MNHNTENKKPRHKINLAQTHRFTVLGLLGILLLYSTASAYTAYQAPTTKKIMVPTLQYEHIGRFNYSVSLKDNTVYNNKTLLHSGEGIFFTRLIDHINITFTDTFQIDQNTEISGNYTVDAILHTSLWTKTYHLIPKTSFSSQGKTASFTTQFPLNITSYEKILAKINEETGVSAQNPQLVIQTTIMVFATNPNGNVTSVFSPSINVSLNQKILSISKNLSPYLSGMTSKSSMVSQEEVFTQRIFWIVFSLIIFICTPLFMFITTSTNDPENTTEKELRKIKKKYDEWIVETKTNPETPISRVIRVKSFEDLLKASEELAKPILLYTSSTDQKHRFYVLEDTLLYEFELQPEKMTIQTVSLIIQDDSKTIYRENQGKEISVVSTDSGTTKSVPIEQPKIKHRGRLLFSDSKK